jgi:hypothetical protein
VAEVRVTPTLLGDGYVTTGGTSVVGAWVGSGGETNGGTHTDVAAVAGADATAARTTAKSAKVTAIVGRVELKGRKQSSVVRRGHLEGSTRASSKSLFTGDGAERLCGELPSERTGNAPCVTRHGTDARSRARSEAKHIEVN